MPRQYLFFACAAAPSVRAYWGVTTHTQDISSSVQALEMSGIEMCNCLNGLKSQMKLQTRKCVL